jgi:hypothetical protein
MIRSIKAIDLKRVRLAKTTRIESQSDIRKALQSETATAFLAELEVFILDNEYARPLGEAKIQREVSR